jgi:hypothetical protein
MEMGKIFYLKILGGNCWVSGGKNIVFLRQ